MKFEKNFRRQIDTIIVMVIAFLSIAHFQNYLLHFTLRLFLFVYIPSLEIIISKTIPHLDARCHIFIFSSALIVNNYPKHVQ